MGKTRRKQKHRTRRTETTFREYLKTRHWQNVRKLYRESNLEQYCIACCSRQFQLHHIVYDRLWRELPGDLIPLCGTCHQRIHWYMEKKLCPRDQIGTILRFAFDLIPETRIVRIYRRFRDAQALGSEISPAAFREAWQSVRSVIPEEIPPGRQVF